MAPRTKVLVVDDSAFARKVVRECLTVAGLEVVGIARDGLEALEKINELKPDVITLDMVMPNLDGMGVLKALAGRASPRVVVVSMSDSDSMLGMAALQHGAFDVVHKPTALAVSQLYEIGEKLAAAVRAAAAAIPRTAAVASTLPPQTRQNTDRELVVIGTSTGGPQALTKLICALPADFPVPIAIVLHIPPGYTAALAQRLDDACRLEVVEGSDGVVFKKGRVVVARAGRHLTLSRVDGALVGGLALQPLDTQHRPSVDVLFQSAAQVVGARTLAVVLTGMGDDGLIGSKAIKDAGGTILTEAASSCVVYGMPRMVAEAGLSSGEAPIEQMLEEIIRFL